MCCHIHVRFITFWNPRIPADIYFFFVIDLCYSALNQNNSASGQIHTETDGGGEIGLTGVGI